MNKIRAFLFRTGKGILNGIEFTGYTIRLFLETLANLRYAFGKWREIVQHMYTTGVHTLPVVSVVALFTGMILALQGGIELEVYHMKYMIGNVVAASLTREMGPFMTAIILIAAVGSAMAAEVGTMKVSEEIDALEIMSISPVRYLVMPRVLAFSITLPIVSIYTITLGVIGGAIVAESHLAVPFDVFYIHVLQSLYFKATYVGLLKAFVFGICISCISCAHGLRASNGASGVGKATRNAVVASFLVILVVGYIITAIFYGTGL
ncbi:MAG: ABC transporter permease [bacterium]|nr:ABC transporter permease [bacterium]